MKRVLVTRAAHQAGKLSEGLKAAGFEAVEVPVLEIRPPADLAPLDRALRALGTYQWLILTSANTVRAVVDRAAEIEAAFMQLGMRVAAVGQATAAAARKAGFEVVLVPETYVAESLLKDLAGQVAGKRILLARAAITRDVIPNALRAAGATLDVVDAYENVMPPDAPQRLREALELGIDAATFTSSSSVTHLADAARAAAIAFPFAGVQAVSIGPITSQTLRDAGWEPAIEAEKSDIPGLIAAISHVLPTSPA